MISRMVAMLAAAGCGPVSLPVPAHKISNRMAAILSVVSPMVDSMRTDGASIADTNTAIAHFNACREHAMVCAQGTDDLAANAEGFMRNGQMLVHLVSRPQITSGLSSVNTMRDLQSAVLLIPALVEVLTPTEAIEPIVILPFGKQAL